MPKSSTAPAAPLTTASIITGRPNRSVWLAVGDKEQCAPGCDDKSEDSAGAGARDLQANDLKSGENGGEGEQQPDPAAGEPSNWLTVSCGDDTRGDQGPIGGGVSVGVLDGQESGPLTGSQEPPHADERLAEPETGL